MGWRGPSPAASSLIVLALVFAVFVLDVEDASAGAAIAGSPPSRTLDPDGLIQSALHMMEHPEPPCLLLPAWEAGRRDLPASVAELNDTLRRAALAGDPGCEVAIASHFLLAIVVSLETGALDAAVEAGSRLEARVSRWQPPIFRAVALELLLDVATRTPSASSARSLAREAISMAGMRLLAAGELVLAEHCLERAAAMDPGHPAFWTMLGNARVGRDRLAEALVAFERVTTPLLDALLCPNGSARVCASPADPLWRDLRESAGDSPRWVAVYHHLLLTCRFSAVLDRRTGLRLLALAKAARPGNLLRA